MNQAIFIQPLHRISLIEGLIHKFAKARNLEIVKDLVKKGADINRQHIIGDESGQTPLCVVSQGVYEEMALYLLGNGASPFLTSKRRCNNRFECLTHGIYYQRCTMHNYLVPMSFFGHEPVITVTLEAVGSEVQVKNALGKVMLYIAAERKIFPIVGSLLQIPVEIFSTSTGESDLAKPVLFETHAQVCDMLFELVRRRPDITITSDISTGKDTPLIISIKLQLWSIARILIQTGKDLEAGSSTGGLFCHALYYAILLNGINILDDLVRCGPAKWGSARMRFLLDFGISQCSVSKVQMVLTLLKPGKIDMDLNVENEAGNDTRGAFPPRNMVRIMLDEIHHNAEAQDIQRLLIEAGAR